jgi:hypothetical protein
MLLSECVTIKAAGTKQFYENSIGSSPGPVRKTPADRFGVWVIGALAAYQAAQYAFNDDLTSLAYAGFCVGV